MQQEQEQTESQKYEHIQKILLKNESLKSLLNLIKQITQKHNDYASQSFSQSDHFKFLKNQIDKIKMEELCQVLKQLKSPNCIVALPIKRQKKFTLFFVIVPGGQKFDWHSHPKMTGISKCVYGHFKISTIDYPHLSKINNSQYVYPKQFVRLEQLSCEHGQSVSIIKPQTYNIHKIQALEDSAFFDLLTPDYPDNTCQFLTTQAQYEDKILLRQLSEPSQQVDGWDVHIKELINRQKYIVKTVILQ